MDGGIVDFIHFSLSFFLVSFPFSCFFLLLSWEGHISTAMGGCLIDGQVLGLAWRWEERKAGWLAGRVDVMAGWVGREFVLGLLTACPTFFSSSLWIVVIVKEGKFTTRSAAGSEKLRPALRLGRL